MSKPEIPHADPISPDTAFLLVHGGNNTAACWDRLTPHLRAPSLAIDLPGRGSNPADPRQVTLADWHGAVVTAIDHLEADAIIVVGHSLAGLFLPAAAAARADRVARLVFVAAVFPREGRTQLENFAWRSRTVSRMVSRSLTRGGVLMPLPTWLARLMFCHDMDAEGTDSILRGLVPEAPGVFAEPVSRAGLTTSGIPTTYVRLTKDRAVPPKMADRQIANYGRPMEIVSIESGHGVMISNPARLARLLNEYIP